MQLNLALLSNNTLCSLYIDLVEEKELGWRHSDAAIIAVEHEIATRVPPGDMLHVAKVFLATGSFVPSALSPEVSERD